MAFCLWLGIIIKHLSKGKVAERDLVQETFFVGGKSFQKLQAKIVSPRPGFCHTAKLN